MESNPEFRRNIWQELTPYRLAGMPLILAAVFYLAFVSDDYRLAGTVAGAANGLFFLITMIWGTKLASETVMNEISEHTWDGQRMSALTPWQLVWGKLFGSTAYTWYGTAICLLVYYLAVPDKSELEAVKTVLALFCAGILAHAVSMLASLLVIQKERKFNKSQTAAILLFGLMAAGPFFSLVLGKASNVTWYGNTYAGLNFTLATVAAYALWAIMGLYQLMRRELQMQNSPLAWYGFVIFLMIYFGGFFSDTEPNGKALFAGTSPALLTGWFVAVAATYFMAFAERKDLISLRQLVRLATAGDSRRFLERAPRWLLTLPVVVLTGVLLVVTASAATPGATLKLASFAIAGICFLGRDLGIMLFCNLAKANRRADLLTIVYLVMLYGIFPATLSVMHQTGATVLFWPRPDQSALPVIIVPLLEMLLVFYLLSLRWQKRLAEVGN